MIANIYDFNMLNRESLVISMSRIRPLDAMEHLGGISRDSFQKWCKVVKLKSHKYEYCTRTYFIKGEFLAIADKEEMEEIKEKYGEKWKEIYKYYAEVVPFLEEEEPELEKKETYKPKSKDVSDFIKKLKE